MLSIQILDIRKFTGMLFSEDTFDRFLLYEAEFITGITTHIDGRFNQDFFPEDEWDRIKEVCVSYSTLRPVCYDLMKGKHLPVSFKMVLMTSRDTTASLVRRSGFTGPDVSSLSINILYKDGLLYLTTGLSYQGFTLDKSMEKSWDETVRSFLLDKECSFEEL